MFCYDSISWHILKSITVTLVHKTAERVIGHAWEHSILIPSIPPHFVFSLWERYAPYWYSIWILSLQFIMSDRTVPVAIQVFISVDFPAQTVFSICVLAKSLKSNGCRSHEWTKGTFRNHKPATRKPFSCKSADFYVKLGWLIIAYNLH